MSLHRKNPMIDEVIGWYHQLNGHESEKTPGDGEGQGSLACCSPWGCKESDTTEQLHNIIQVDLFGFPCGSAGKKKKKKKIHLQCGRARFNPWVGKIPWRRERLPTPVFWPGEFHGPVHGVAKSDMAERFSLLHSPDRV